MGWIKSPLFYATATKVLAGVALVAAVSTGSWAAFANSASSSAKTAAPTESTTTTSATPAASPSAGAPAATDVSTPAPSPTTTAAPATSRPSVLVAASEKGRLVLIDTKSGKTTKVLTTFPDAAFCRRLIGDVTLTPDSKTVYFTHEYASGKSEFGTDECSTDVYKMSTSGGTPEIAIKNARSGHVSPDGTKLIYVALSQDPLASGSGDLMVRTLSNGKDSLIKSGVSCDCGSVLTSWAPDNRHFAVQQINCGCGGQEYEAITIYDTSDTASTREVRMPRQIDGKAQWAHPTYRPDGSMFVIEYPTLTFDQKTEQFVPLSDAPRMLLIDPQTSTVKKVITTGFKDAHYEYSATDSTGNHILYIRNGTLMVSDDLQRPTQLATGLVAADW